MNDNDGRLVRAATFPNGDEIHPGEHTLLQFVSTYHGDRDEHWIVRIAFGDDEPNIRKELERHNCRYVESIVWDD